MATRNEKGHGTGVALPDALAAALRGAPSPEEAMALLRDRGRQPGERLGNLVGAAVEALEPGAVTAGLLESLEPSAAVSGRTRLQMIAGIDRQIARLQAQQSQWIASFARPGVAASYPELLDLAVLGKGTRMDTDELLELLPLRLQDDPYACDKVLAQHPDWQAELDELAGKAAAHEIGAVLGIAPISARNRIRQAHTLVHDYSRTLEAMLEGKIDRLKSTILIEELDAVSPDLRSELEESALPQASEFTAGRWGKRLRKWAIETDPESADRRAENARQNRKVRVTPTDTDAARFSADVSAEQALLAWAVLNHTADQLPDDIRAGRTLDQLRADIFAGIFADLAEHGYADLRHPDVLPESLRLRPPTDNHPTDKHVAGEPPANRNQPAPGNQPADGDRPVSDEQSVSGEQSAGSGPASGDAAAPDREPVEPWSPCIAATVIIGASTLAGLDNDPALLAGYGWITASLARALAASASSLRLAIQHDADVSPPDPAPPPRPVPPGPTPADPALQPKATSPDPAPPPNPTAPRPAPAPSCAGRPGHDGCSPDVSAGGVADRACGTDLDHGRAVYRPPTAVADRVRQRDQVCRFFGCAQRAERCDLDHRVPFDAGGPTCPCNLDDLCRPHHMGKTFLQWRAIRLPANHLRWTSPHGYVVDDHPEPQPLGSRFTLADLQAAAVPPPGVKPPAPPPPPRGSSPADDPPPF